MARRTPEQRFWSRVKETDAECCSYWGHGHVWGTVWKSWRGVIQQCACGRSRTIRGLAAVPPVEKVAARSSAVPGGAREVGTEAT